MNEVNEERDNRATNDVTAVESASSDAETFGMAPPTLSAIARKTKRLVWPDGNTILENACRVARAKIVGTIVVVGANAHEVKIPITPTKARSPFPREKRSLALLDSKDMINASLR